MTTGVVVDFNANLARYTSGVDKAIADLNRFQSHADRIGGNITKAFGALGVGLGVGAFASLIKGSVDAQDHLLDLSKTTRLSVEDLSGLSSAAKKSGSDLDGTAKSINKLAVEMGKDGEKFKALGITAKDPLVAFGQLADVMNAIDDPQKRAAVGAVALGKSWADAAPLMAEGGKAIREMIELGKAQSKVTTESAKRADELNDKLTDLKTIAGGWTTAVANPIVEGMLKISNALNLEIDRKPGSIAEFLMGPDRGYGYKGPRDARGLPTPGSPPEDPKTPGKPTAKALDKFIGGEKGSKGKTDLQRMIELGQKNQASVIDSEEEMRILAASRAMKDATEEFSALQRMIKVGEENELAAYYETAGEETMRLVAAQRELKDAGKDAFADLTLAMEGWSNKASDTFADFVVDGKASFSDLINSMLKDIARLQAKRIFDPITKGANDWLSGALSSGLGNLFGGSSPAASQGFGMAGDAGSLLGFAGGGFTGMGARSGGIDGQGGFLAMLHPRETVIDHTTDPGGGGGGVTIVQNLNFAVGISQTVRAEIMNLMPQIQAASQSAVMESRLRGGSARLAFKG